MNSSDHFEDEAIMLTRINLLAVLSLIQEVSELIRAVLTKLTSS